MKTLKIGTATIDITAPLEVGILMSSVKEEYRPFEFVRLPLKGRIIVLEQQRLRIGIVVLDLLGLSSKAVGGWESFKRSLSDLLPPDRIIVICTHTHSSHETAGLTNLYQTERFKDWVFHLSNNINQAIKNAISNLQECELKFGITELKNYSLQRRILKNGKVIMSDSIQPIEKKYFELKPNDFRIHGLKFTKRSGENIATLIHALCHPVHEMCSSYITPDYPGEICRAMEEKDANGTYLFVNGACGDINPPTVSVGAEAAEKHGKAIADRVEKLNWEKREKSPMQMLQSSLSFKIRKDTGIDAEDDGTYRITTLSIGDVAMVFLSGENFIDTAAAIENGSPFKNTIIIGYAENYVGYVPPLRVFDEGGYEVGPGKWSYLEVEAQDKVITRSIRMLKQLHSF